MQLEQLDKQICDLLQRGLNICRKPFADIAEQLHTSEENVLSRIDKLLKSGVVRRLAAMIDYQSLGRVSTLVTAAVDTERVEEVADAVSKLENVSHNYQRDHLYNLWFTLQGKDETDIDRQLEKLCEEFKVDFKSMPVEKFFKLNVNFDIAGNSAAAESKKPTTEIIELTELQRQILTKIQQGIEPISDAYDFLCDEQVDIESLLEVLQQLKDAGVIKRIAAVLNHRLLGFDANVMFVCKVDQNQADGAGQRLAGYKQVSHCYLRRAFDGFDYNLFGMMHARTMAEIESLVQEFISEENISDYQLLRTVREFKKKPVRYDF